MEQRALLKAKANADVVPDVLVMTATPIPRTAAMLVYGDLDKSELREMPPGRTPIATEVTGTEPLDQVRMWQLLRDEVQAGHQAYVVCPRIGGDEPDDSDAPDEDPLDTDDTEGKVTKTSDLRPAAEAIRDLLPQFTGMIEQTPPQYSAIKIQGERAYDLARDGEIVELKPRPVEIHYLALVEQPDSSHSVFEAECGKGTYVRALARDIGRILGCYGHICALRRTLVGPFGEADMIPLEQLEALCDRAASGEGSLADALLPVETALDDIPALAVTRADAARLHRGQAVLLRGRDAPNCSGTVYVTVAGRLLALAEIGNGELIPKRVFNLNGLTASPARNNESV